MRDASVPKDLRQLSHGDVTAKCYSRYDVNGFHFRTVKLEASRPLAATTNSGVVTTSSNGSGDIFDYYGVLENIIEYTFGGDKKLKVVFFDCKWFDPHNGTRLADFGMVEVNHGSRLSGQVNNIVLVHQVEQVYYLSYPHPSLKAWWIAFRVNPEIYTYKEPSHMEGNLPDDVGDVYQEEATMADEFTISDGTGLNRLPTDVLDLIIDEPGPSSKRPRKSARIRRLQQRLNQT
jgi:hypothetical protein